MPGLNWLYLLPAVFLVGSMILAVALVFVGPIILLRWSSNRALIVLALIACVAALVFTPIVRVSNELLGIYLFFAGFVPIAGVITATVVTTSIRLLRTRRWAALPGLLLSLAAASLMYVNTTTPWLWPYARY